MKKQEYVQNQRTRQIPTKEIEISNLLDKDFKVMVIKIVTEIGRRLDKYNENFKKRENIRKYQIEVITKLKSKLKGVQWQNGLNRICELEDKAMGNIQTEQQN